MTTDTETLEALHAMGEDGNMFDSRYGEHAGKTPSMETGAPRPEWVVGTCDCGQPLVINTYHVGGFGFHTFKECWSCLNETGTCQYRKRIA